MAQEREHAKFDRGRLEEMLAPFREVDGALLPILHAVQDEFGYVPPEAVEPIARFLRSTPPQVYAIITFYSLFRTKPQGGTVVGICRGPACRLAGSPALQRQVETRLGIRDGETTPNGRLSLETVSCLGICALAPAVEVGHDLLGRADQAQLEALVDAAQEGRRNSHD